MDEVKTSSDSDEIDTKMLRTHEEIYGEEFDYEFASIKDLNKKRKALLSRFKKLINESTFIFTRDELSHELNNLIYKI